jgi:hypothetical protein
MNYSALGNTACKNEEDSSCNVPKQVPNGIVASSTTFVRSPIVVTRPNDSISASIRKAREPWTSEVSNRSTLVVVRSKNALLLLNTAVVVYIAILT